MKKINNPFKKFPIENMQIESDPFPTMYLKTFKPHCNNFPNCKDCKTNIWLNEWYDGDAKKQADELGVELPEREPLINKIHRQLFYTVHLITERVESQNVENWYYDITNYIDYNLESFGRFSPKGNLGIFRFGTIPYLTLLETAFTTWIKPENEPERKRLEVVNKYIESQLYESENPIESTDIDTLFDTFNKWIEAFPFEWEILNLYVKKFPKSIPIFTHKVYNPYIGITKMKILPKSKLVQVLIQVTNHLINKIDFYDLVKRDIINVQNVDENEFILWHKQFKLSNGIETKKYELNELEYAETLNKWLIRSKESFEYLKGFLEKSATETITTKPNNLTNEKDLWRCVPTSIAKEHFRVFYTNNSKNGKPFLTEIQYNDFIKRAFENDTNIEKQTFNFSSGEKGFVIKRFYEFFDLSMMYGEKSDKQPYIDLVMDNFTNWNKESEVKSFMKPDKSKRKW